MARSARGRGRTQMNWRDFWNQDTPIYVNDRHKTLHYQIIARDIAGFVPSPEAVVLDHGCGEALSAGRVAGRCGKLYLCDAAPLVRERLKARFGDNRKIVVLAPDDAEDLPEASLDLVVANSLVQYLSFDEFRELLRLWRAKLKPEGRLVVADVIPHEAGAAADAKALLDFAWKGGFLAAALVGLGRTAFSQYRTVRNELGLTRYGEAEMIELLRAEGFGAERRPQNVGHNPSRMTFVARRD
jgi:SAM-dependent methyltransferase